MSQKILKIITSTNGENSFSNKLSDGIIEKLKESDPESYAAEAESVLPHFNRLYADGSTLYLVGEAGSGEVDAHGLAVAHLQPQTLAAAAIGHGEIAAQKAGLAQIATLQQAAPLTLPIVEAAVDEAAIAQIQPGEVAADKAALRELLPLNLLLLEPLPLETLALDHPQPLL